MVTKRPVIMISNDVVPGMALPVAAPGLRVFGMAEGLQAHDYAVTSVVVSGPVDTAWQGAVPPPSSENVVVLPATHLGDYVRTNSPATVILTNSNQIDHLGDLPDVRIILDFFAPKMLELANSTNNEPYPTEQLAALRERKLRAIVSADGFLVNGRKKLPYFLAWLLQTDVDVRTVPYVNVDMCVPARFRERPDRNHVEFALAGYLQGWSQPGTWLRTLGNLLSPDDAHLNVLMPDHWGHAERIESPLLTELVSNKSVVRHDAKTFSDFQDWMATMDVAVDLFSHNTEREFAMVTRSIVALACGVPVVHPSFTEVSPMIRQYDAGWIVDPGDDAAIRSTFGQIMNDPDERRKKAHNARQMWRERLDPVVAVEPLVEMLQSLDA